VQNLAEKSIRSTRLSNGIDSAGAKPVFSFGDGSTNRPATQHRVFIFSLRDALLAGDVRV